MAILLGGALTCVLAVCAVAGLFILKNASTNNQPRDRQVAPASGRQSSGEAKGGVPSPQLSLVDVVVDACDAGRPVATKLVPGGREISNDATATDTESACQWGKYAQAKPRALTVTLRSIQGGSPMQLAKSQFTQEWSADKTGDTLAAGQTLRSKKAITGVGEQGYALYFTQTGVGEAIVNVQISNVLITVHYGGESESGGVMPETQAVDGAVEAVKATIQTLEKAAQ
ncbi:MAG: hypothetical protein ABIS86_24330 [Streptosporangiaceae bacterium]